MFFNQDATLLYKDFSGAMTCLIYGGFEPKAPVNLEGHSCHDDNNVNDQRSSR